MGNCDFTSGPWKQTVGSNGDDFSIEGPNGEAVLDGCGCCGSPYMQNVKDAPLLGSSRELFDALDNLLGRISVDKDAKRWFLDEQKAAKDALAKARGEQ